MRRILLTATSYPRSPTDWQGVFIREMLAGLARTKDSKLSYWGPPGPVPDTVEYLGSESDSLFLNQLADLGGIAHLLRSNPLSGFARGFGLIRRLRAALARHQDSCDVFHLNWLQSALAIPGRGKRAVVTVLGTDYKLLEIPGVTALLRHRFSHNRVALAPNAQWMVPKLKTTFGDCVDTVEYVPLGIDQQFYDIPRACAAPGTRHWITVLRVTKAKIGPLFQWTEDLARDGNEFHLFGPMQEQITLPSWIHYHGPATPEQLIRDWYPRASAMITLSQHDEGRPQVLLEAMASALPVIASRLPAHADLLESAAGGLMVSNQQQFAAALQTLSDESTRAALGSAARQAIKTSYGTWDDCADRYQDLYTRLLRTSTA